MLRHKLPILHLKYTCKTTLVRLQYDAYTAVIHADAAGDKLTNITYNTASADVIHILLNALILKQIIAEIWRYG